MADGGVKVQSLQERIAALNLGQVGRGPGVLTRATTIIPEAEQRPQVDQRSTSTTGVLTRGVDSIPPQGEPNGARRNGVLPPPTIKRTGQEAPRSAKPNAPPRLPPRTPSMQSSPSLPPRRPSAPLGRRDSSESIASTMSNLSTFSNLSSGTARTSVSRSPSTEYGRMMAPAFDPSNLPPLPPKRPTRKVENRRIPPVKAETREPGMMPVAEPPASKVLSVPPQLPTRQDSFGVGKALVQDKPPPVPSRPGRSFGMNKARDQQNANAVEGERSFPATTSTSTVAATPRSLPPPTTNGVPPPIPLTSRPDLSSFQTKNLLQHNPPSVTSCLLCRDFSGPDTHAAKFPRQSVPSLDWLAPQLVAPFSSPTDRARAIFTWLHHNVSYDVVGFFNKTLKPSTPASTLSTGLAVCQGYADLFTALASKVGLESVVVGGHGKGFGFTNLSPGAPIPSEGSNHAWNAVKIDSGEWKLIDCCWGAGHIQGEGKPYTKSFTPSFFTMSNEDFGLRHFPTNKSQFFRADGRRIPWDEYILGDRGGELVQVFSGVAPTEGLAETKILPKYLKVPITPSKHSSPTVRFQFEKVCEHWDPVRHGPGKPYVYILNIHGQDGRQDDYVPFQTNGALWWADIPPLSLGAPGQTITLYTVETVEGADARGWTVEQYEAANGRKAMGFNGVAAWELVA